MNPFKNISVFRDQDIYSTCSLRPWSYENAGSQWPLQRDIETTPFPEKEEYKGNSDYYNSQLAEIEHLIKKEELLKQENDRLQHLTTVLIDHIWKKQPFPLKEIDKRMAEYDKKQSQTGSVNVNEVYDDGGIDGTPRNA
jgi:hypothetical protein